MAADSTSRTEVGVSESQATVPLERGLELASAEGPLGGSSGAHQCLQEADGMLLPLGSGQPFAQHTETRM